MSTLDDNDPPSSHPLDDAAADMANGTESGAEEETEAPPAQPLGVNDVDDDHDASRQDEENGNVKPLLLVEHHDPHRTAIRAYARIAKHIDLYQRGDTIVALWEDEKRGRVTAKGLTPDDIMSLVHELAQPYAIKTDRSGSHRRHCAFPAVSARTCLSANVVAMLPPLDGIAYAPRIEADGTIHDSEGYDARTHTFFYGLPELNVPAYPTKEEGEAAFLRLRAWVWTFPFGDSTRVKVDGIAEPVVDLNLPPGVDETAYLTGLVTVACRPSLDLVPGLLITAPPHSGAGTGKGKLARFLCEVACGISPIAMTAGHSKEEFDKRLVAVLLGAEPFIMIDNLNDQELDSDQLASAITENPTQVRPMRTSELVQLNPSTSICVTGNGASVTEDLGRRFLTVTLNAGVENPEARSFEGNFLEEAKRERGEILSDIFTIVRWGVQQGDALPSGRPLGSFEVWGRRCRDAVMAFSGRDPVVDIANRQANDSRRSELAELVDVWRRHHGDRPMKANDLNQDVVRILAPYGESRQKINTKLMRMNGVVYGAYRFKLIPKEPGVDSDRNRFMWEHITPALRDQNHRPGGGDNDGQIETVDGLDGLGGPARPPLTRRM